MGGNVITRLKAMKEQHYDESMHSPQFRETLFVVVLDQKAHRQIRMVWLHRGR